MNKQSNVKQIVLKAQRGDMQAFSMLYEYLYDKLYGYTFKKTFDHEATGDIVANTFVKLLKSLGGFSWVNEAAFYGWVYKIACSEVANYFKKQSKYNLDTEYFDDEDCNLFEEIKQNNMNEQVDKNLDKDRLHTAMKKLKKREKHIIELYYFAGMSHKEIAQIKTMSPVNVRVISHRAIKKLESILTKNEYQLITERAEAK